MAKVTLRPIEDHDIDSLACNLRDDDRREITAIYGPDVVNAIRASVRQSDPDFTFAAEYKGELIAMIGCGSLGLLGNAGMPWLLGTDEVKRHAKSLCILSRQHLTRWLERYRVLINHVDARNELHITWLKRMGFEFGDPIPVGIFRMPFYPFKLER